MKSTRSCHGTTPPERPRLVAYPFADTHVDEIDHAVLQLLYQGFSAKEIAQQVEISHRTVEHRIERMKARIGARTISQLVALSIASGLTGKIPGS
nr:helix-turn-helix transcriptional regulator [Rhizobium leguminosarum]